MYGEANGQKSDELELYCSLLTIVDRHIKMTTCHKQKLQMHDTVNSKIKVR